MVLDPTVPDHPEAQDLATIKKKHTKTQPSSCIHVNNTGIPKTLLILRYDGIGTMHHIKSRLGKFLHSIIKHVAGTVKMGSVENIQSVEC